ncbi:MAG: AEC family transporter [Alphaproteobacteria bacterium]|uniref:AEC family transporter n=1 Tax=Pacificispira sp. TaxID=2888761 RepID=UPI001B249AE4|nr:AEC family transporter [Alphaproteobacteria bacterium]MBO6862349.1 AEC family transporter [Alphaproteobacteria bacterium]MEC9268889.1 AEC family transporter [Pseudomonadota bacterium]
MLADLFSVLAPVFVTAGIGFAWIKAGRTLDTNQFTPIIVFVGSPCLVFSTLMESGVDIGLLGQIAGIAILAHAAALTMGFLALKAGGYPLRAFLPSLMLPNTGNMGLPLCLFAFGDIGLALGIAYFTISALLQFTVGISIAAGGMSVKRALSTPHIYVVSLAVLLLWTGTTLPEWVSNTVHLIGQFTIPLMLLFLGVSLARLTVQGVGRAVILSVVRIGGGLAVGVLLVWAFGLTGPAAGVVLIQSSMPVAVFNYLFAQYYDNSPAEVAGLVVVSTAISFATLPFLLAFVL